ncbi:MAG: hypothetical protein M1839_000352 [Geoglossum umbratile]|nr:MAG: hypothetical protein M1839_000352 [Geoglossum umbratile]
MSKTAKIKKKTPSLHSRAAKRESSPSLNLDKSLKNAKPPLPNPARPSIATVYQGAGVTKKSKKSKQLTTKQRRRLTKGIERAEDAEDKLGKRIEKSRGKEKVVKERRVGWETTNDKITLEKDSAPIAKDELLGR